VETWEDCSFTSDRGETSAVEALTRVRKAPHYVLLARSVLFGDGERTETESGRRRGEDGDAEMRWERRSEMESRVCL